MTAADYGSFSFGLALLLFLGIFFEFGIFLPAARLMALETESARPVVGAALLTYVPIGLAYSLTVFLLSFGVDSWFRVEVGSALRVAALVAPAVPFSLVAMQLAQGAGRLHIYSLSSALGPAVFLVVVVVAVVSDAEIGVTSALVASTASLIPGALILVAWLRPRFEHAREQIRRLLRQAREYGFQAYLGRILGTGTYQLDVLMLGALTNASTVGYYALAGTVSAMVGLPVLGMASALFSRMAHATRVQPRWLLAAWTGGLGGAAVLWLAADPIVTTVFSDKAKPAVELVGPLALAQAIMGVTGIYNGFLNAHGRGRELRNAALALAVTNVALNLALIPPFGAPGAAWASVGAVAVNLLVRIVLYRRSLGLPQASVSLDGGTGRVSS